MRSVIIRRSVFTLALAVSFCALAAAAPAIPGDFLIVPGQRIGQTPLGSQGSRTLSRLPRPYRHDVGMSQTYSVWVSHTLLQGRRNTLFIHTTSNGALNVKPLDGVTIDVIRVTSPRFQTTHGLHVGSTLAQIRRRFPRARAITGETTIYDDMGGGIAFEFPHPPVSQSHSIAVMIHPSGESHTANARQVRDLVQSPLP